MAITARAAGAWVEYRASGTVAIPAGATTGDRMYLFATWKTYTITASVSGWTAVGTAYADGTTAAGNGTGSMRVQCWYKDHTGTESNPTLAFSTSPGDGAAVIIVFQKGSTESWGTPEITNAAISIASTWSATGAANLNIAAGDLLVGLVGFRDDSATMTRNSTTGIGATGITWSSNVNEYPATHATYNAGTDCSADIVYRIASSGTSSAAPTMTGTLSAVETGAALFVKQTAAVAATTYSVQAQAQATILLVQRSFAQALGQIKQTYNAFAQANAQIQLPTYTYQVVAQGQALIKQTYIASANALAHIKTTAQSFAQSNTLIKRTENVSAQAQALIKRTEQAYAQAQAKIIITAQSFGQAQTLIKSTVQGYAQANAKILGITQERVSGQAQTLIKQTYIGSAQVLSLIKRTAQANAQAQTLIKTAYKASGQAQTAIKAVGRGFGQAQASLLILGASYGQAQAYIKGTVSAVGQALAFILGQTAPNTAYGQAMAYIYAGIIKIILRDYPVLTMTASEEDLNISLTIRTLQITLTDREVE